MGMTVGNGPFGQKPAGTWDFEPPARVTYVEPFPRRVRGMLGGATVVDSDAVKLVHHSRHLPYWVFPAADVQVDATPSRAVPGFVEVKWDAVEAWYEEDERVFVHVRDPYHRVDCYSTSRRVRVTLDDVVLADTTAAVALYETGLPPRFYLPPEAIRMELLERSETSTGCPYKGTASYWSARIGDRTVDDVAWAYLDPLREAERVRGHLCFYDDRVTVEVEPTPNS
jgi:uncharacterized protein (DUF427 family)